MEVERPKIGTTASVKDKGRDSLNYSTVTEQKAVISKEQIMSLADMHGYWKYGDVVVPFRLPLAPVRAETIGYIERQKVAEVVELPALENRSEPPRKRTDTNVVRSQPKSRKKRTKNQPRRGKRDQRKFEHVIKEKEKLLAEQLVMHQEEAGLEVAVNQVPTSQEVAAETSTMEIGMVDPQLEAMANDFL